MTTFENKYFQKLNFAKSQTNQYFTSARRDLDIAANTEIAELRFKFAYDALIKIGITLVVKQGYKVRSQAGHHVRIL